MSYTPTNWSNKKAPGISDKNLNKIEDELVKLDKIVSVPDITETTETTMQNSYDGRLLVNEIGGVCEQLSPTGKNVLGTTIATTTTNGVTCTKNGNGTYTLNGTASADITFTLNDFSIDKVSYKMKIFSLGGTHSGSVSFTTLDANWGNQKTVKISDNYATLDVYNVYSHWRILVTKGTVCNNLVVGLMVANDVSVWEPYTGGQPAPSPSYPQEIKKSVVSGVKTHGKNFLDARGLVEKTYNGVTFTPVYDASGNLQYVNVNGTTTAKVDYNIKAMPQLPAGDYILSGCIGGSSSTYTLAYSNYVNKAYFDYGSGVNITPFDYSTYPSSRVQIEIASGITLSNVRFYPMIRKADIEDTTYETYKESSITLSNPIDLYGKGDVQDVITPKNNVRKFATRRLTGNENGFGVSSTYKGSFYFSCVDIGGKPQAPYFCTHAIHKGIEATNFVYGTCISNGESYNLWLFEEQKTVAEIREYLANNEVYITYELVEEVTEALPTADQIALNSLATYDGITYLEFDSEVQPTFEGEYGTSKVGGYTLEALLTARSK